MLNIFTIISPYPKNTIQVGRLKKLWFSKCRARKKYSNPVRKLKIGDKVLAYLKGQIYGGYGEVVSTAIIAKDFRLDDGWY